MQRIAAIMAGGRGERLWPRSRAATPKQFLSLGGERSFLQATYDRLVGMPQPPELVVLTAEGTLPLVWEQLPQLAPERVLGEPVGRDTAATAVLAACLARAVAGEDAVLALIPADHAVFGVDAYQRALEQAFSAAETHRVPVLLGVPPTRPETGYGYILQGDAVEGSTPGALREVVRFVEKPSLEVAVGYLAEGNYLWNGGVCVCRTDVLLEGLARHRPEMAGLVAALAGAHPGQLGRGILRELLEPVQPISLDYAFLEHCERALVVRAEMPGIDPDKDVDITVSDGMLHISAERTEEEEKKGRHFHRRELRYGSFARSLPVPEGVDEQQISATYKDGMLEVRVPLPAAEAAKTARRVPVSHG